MMKRLQYNVMTRTSAGFTGLCLILLLGSQPVAAQCTDGVENSAIPAATPDDDFLVRTEGTVLHQPTRLIWQRCAIGQSWTGTSCSGQAQLMDWETALQTAQNHVQAEESDWRIPNRNELASIVETRCHSPAINGVVFPSTPLEWFWTSSPTRGQTDQAWVVTFIDGELQSAAISGQYAVRLVRAGRN